MKIFFNLMCLSLASGVLCSDQKEEPKKIDLSKVSSNDPEVIKLMEKKMEIAAQKNKDKAQKKVIDKKLTINISNYFKQDPGELSKLLGNKKITEGLKKSCLEKIFGKKIDEFGLPVVMQVFKIFITKERKAKNAQEQEVQIQEKRKKKIEKKQKEKENSQALQIQEKPAPENKKKRKNIQPIEDVLKEVEDDVKVVQYEYVRNSSGECVGKNIVVGNCKLKKVQKNPEEKVMDKKSNMSNLN